MINATLIVNDNARVRILFPSPSGDEIATTTSHLIELLANNHVLRSGDTNTRTGRAQRFWLCPETHFEPSGISQ